MNRYGILLFVIVAYVFGVMSANIYTEEKDTALPLDESSSSEILHVESSSVEVDLSKAKQPSSPIISSVKIPKKTLSASAESIDPKVGVLASPSSTDSNAEHISDAAHKEISEEKIDNLLPKPFAEQLKNNHGALREKYSAFAEAEVQTEWEKTIQNHLWDGITGTPYSKYIKIDSLQCKAGICEIRLYETKVGVWSYIQAEMALQEWWPFGASSSSGFTTSNPSVNGWYVLLAKS